MRPRSLLLAASAVVSQVALVRAQAEGITNATCLPAFSWMTNSKGQIPCLVSAYLSSDCYGGPWSVNALPPGSKGPYQVPAASTANQCRCNTVAYDLISACSVCQGGIASTWSEWTQNCPQNITAIGKYPRTVPAQTALPNWAYWDPTTNGGLFNATAAEFFDPSKSGSGGGGGGGSKTNVGAIVGGVIGGLIGLAIIGLLAWWIIRRSNAKRAAAPAAGGPPVGQVPYTAQPQYDPNTGYGSPPPGQFSPYADNAPLRPYDPNDPSTFPPTPAHSGPNAFPQSPYPHHQQPYAAPNAGGHYSGAAEV